MKLKLSPMIFAGIGLLVLFFILRACGWYGASISGRVLEEGTKKPLADAFVVVRWQSQVAALVVSGETVCYHVEVVKTDKDGNYKTPFWWSSGWNSPLDHYTDVNVYRAGYVTSDKTYEEGAQRNNIHYLKPFKGTREERLDYLRKFPTGCGHDDGLGQKRLDLLAVMYDEAKSLMNNEPKPSQWEKKMYYGFKWDIAQAHVDPHWKLAAEERARRIKRYIKEYLQ